MIMALQLKKLFMNLRYIFLKIDDDTTIIINISNKVY
jgi:hypothetical protein